MHFGRTATARRLTLATLALATCLSWAGEGGRGPHAPPAARLRRPVDAALLADGHTLCVANQRSGTLSLVDLSGPRLRGEFVVGEHLTGLAALPDRKHMLALDDRRHQLIALSCDSGRLTVRARLAVGPYPVSVAVQPDGTRATVACQWSRRLEVVDLSPLSGPARSVKLRVLHVLRLPFAPRTQLVLPHRSRVVVADAFGGHLAVADVSSGRLSAVHSLNGHNLRGLALDASGKRLLVSHQVLDQKAPTTRDKIRRGVLMNNVVRSIPLESLLSARANLDKASRLLRLGTVGAGAADPAGLAVLDGGSLAVALAGVHDVALVGGDGKTIKRIAVGRRPTALVPGPTKHSLVALNTFDDSLSVLDARRGGVRSTVRLGPAGKLGYADRGELLFYDARLARDGWMSCHSCHSEGHSNGLLADTLGDGTFGTPKRTLTLMNTRLTDPWGWNGKVQYLQDQVRKSLAETMHAPSVREGDVGDLTSFLSELPPPPAPEPLKADSEDRERVKRGRRVFEERRCGRCHIPPLTYSSGGVHDVGFADEKGLREFNPPSLRGVGQGYRFLHDNRAATLEEVFTKFRHKVGGASRSDIDDLVRFLRSL
jgi:DNA-binding beta-propeller fold protein YncE